MERVTPADTPRSGTVAFDRTSGDTPINEGAARPTPRTRLIAGRYRLIGQLGMGGMGVTYRAWDSRSSLPVVIKTPREDVRDNKRLMDRFAREVSTMRALAHENIVPITDQGEDKGCPFVAMRFLPGGSLAEYRGKGKADEPSRVPPSVLRFWLPSIARALDFIHSKGVLHRDVKPGNIFLDVFLQPFLGDFGIAKIVEESGELKNEGTLTGTGMLVGTPDYMAPELFRPGASVDGRVDQYALAVIIYELLSGRKPFLGDSAHIIVEHVSKEPPSLQKLCPDIPRRVADAVHRALAKNPEYRFASCEEFADAVLANVPPLAFDTSRARLLCPNCRVVIRVPTTMAGQTSACARCRALLRVAKDLGALWIKGEDAAIGQDSGEIVFLADSTNPQSEITNNVDDDSRGSYRLIGNRWVIATAAGAAGIILGAVGGLSVTRVGLQQEVTASVSQSLSVAGQKAQSEREQEAKRHEEEVTLLNERLTQQEKKLGAALADLDSVQKTRIVEVRVLTAQKEELLASLEDMRTTNDSLRTIVKKLESADTVSKPAAATLADSDGIKQAKPLPDDLPKMITNSVGIELKLLPAGMFTMGSAEKYEVTLTKPFYMGVYEVTNAQWQKVMGKATKSNERGDNHPVENVTWGEAMEFCRRLAALPMEQRERRVYRLPTEAEWEYACRAGSTTSYSFGNDESQLEEYGWFGGNSGGNSHPIGQKQPNAWGLYDMHGNVFEWCSDTSKDYPGGAVTDPQPLPRAFVRGSRGGSFTCSAEMCRSTIRFRQSPSVRGHDQGFRLVMSPSAVESVTPEAGE